MDTTRSLQAQTDGNDSMIRSMAKAAAAKERAKRSEQSTEFVNELIDRIFKKLFSMYEPSKFSHVYGEGQRLEMTKHEWKTSDLVHVDKNQIAFALAKTKTQFEWPPNLAEFYKFCKSTIKMLGIPDVEQAYHQATIQNWDECHIAVRVAAKHTGYFELRGCKRSEIYQIFKRNYEIVQDRLIAGENIELDIPKALEHKDDSPPVSQEQLKQAKSRFKDLKKELRQ